VSPAPGSPDAGRRPNRNRQALPPLTRDAYVESVPSPPSPEPRDAQVRAVRRVTRGVAAAAVLGTAVFGGLAAAGAQGQGGADDQPAAAAEPDDDRGSVRGAVDSALDEFFGRSDSQAPAPTDGTPVAPSGGS
jgi:hypothetical protein